MSVSLIHDITQLGYIVQFDADFEGMVSICYMEDSNDGPRYIRHEHVGFPGANKQELSIAVGKSLNDFLTEAITGTPKRDGLTK